MSKRGLGKGLDALLATSSMAREKQQVASHSQALSADGELTELAIGSLKPGVYQPRKDMAPDALEELAASIQSQGIIQPIVVRPLSQDHYEIIAGERRWRAARQAGLKQVPCLVKKVEDRAAIAMALIENIQREDLNVIEEAQALERLQNEFELTHQKVAEVIGKSRTTVSNLLRLNQLAAPVKELVVTKQLEMGHARALLALEGEQQVEAANTAARKQLTVRQTEQLVKKCLKPEVEAETQPQDQEAIELSRRLTEKLQANVTIVRTGTGKSKVTITLDEPHKLEQLIAKLED
ncbi:ParB/RepB/Spo0J family partition protein [Vibrio fortis]|jgi:ParB family chromosome partitioning protein|uniref:Probable chromosome-partitioning protein ParB n=1 Tax=Vibrio fortis TaxID=212667 RepID=A0A066V280_9VIBR|nr:MULTISPECIES: ParB/RepB/Spo0J family partition protein [Vibrio]KAB0302050.1 ParB/RepB/Spo0J family partition protein [Vibrio fortis]KDN30678.1 chromosome partitioning protein ParB [Vibrio fortis]QFT11243.1 putative chromosome-partitioning protein ParB [Vibrio sp. THAF190c]|tara:strand:- start:580 stop:1461 length:882 start_codon:yes stop_codon:yes gene_type:complete